MKDCTPEYNRCSRCAELDGCAFVPFGFRVAIFIASGRHEEPAHV